MVWPATRKLRLHRKTSQTTCLKIIHTIRRSIVPMPLTHARPDVGHRERERERDRETEKGGAFGGRFDYAKTSSNKTAEIDTVRQHPASIGGWSC